MTEEDFEKFKFLTEFDVTFLGSYKTVEMFKEWYFSQGGTMMYAKNWFATHHPFLPEREGDSKVFIIFPDYIYISQVEKILKDYIQIS